MATRTRTHKGIPTQPPAEALGVALALARKRARLTQKEVASQFAHQIDRSRISRWENGDWSSGICHEADLIELGRVLRVGRDDLSKLQALRLSAEQEHFPSRERARWPAAGRRVHAEIVEGDGQVEAAIVALIQNEPPTAVLRNTGVKGRLSYKSLAEGWTKYRGALARFIESNPQAVFKRLEYAPTPAQLDLAVAADEALASGREIATVHNVRVKFAKVNPIVLHVLIGENQALLALPKTSGEAGSSFAVVLRDPASIAALQKWYDQVLWDECDEVVTVDFGQFAQDIERIRNMYGFEAAANADKRASRSD